MSFREEGQASCVGHHAFLEVCKEETQVKPIETETVSNGNDSWVYQSKRTITQIADKKKFLVEADSSFTG